MVKRDRLGGARVRILFSFIVGIGVVGGIYWFFHYEKQSAYFEERYLRATATMARQMAARIQAIDDVLDVPQERREDFDEVIKASEIKLQRVDQATCTKGHATHILLASQTDTLRFRRNYEDKSRYCFDAAFDDLLPTPFREENVQEAVQGFDEVLLAWSDGTVVRQRETGSTFLFAQFEELPKAIQGGDATGARVLQLAGRRYKSFVQRVPIELERRTQTATTAGGLVIAGLVREDRFNADVAAVSPTFFLVAIVLLVLGLLCWPLLKIMLLGWSERLKKSDVGVLVISSVVTVFSVGVVAIVLWARFGIKEALDQDLHGFSQHVLIGLSDELKIANDRLTVFTQTLDTAALAQQAKTADRKCKLQEVSKQGGLYCCNEGKDASHWRCAEKADLGSSINLMIWSDEQGTQRYKQYKETLTRFINLRDRDYFKDALAGKLSELKSVRTGTRAHGHAVVAALRSRTRGTQTGVIAVPTQSPRGVAQAVLDLNSVRRAVSPFGFQVALLDQRGHVMMHSELEQHLQENLFQEIEKSAELQDAMRARVPYYLTTRYQGALSRFYVRPVPGLDWFLLVYRDNQLLDTASINMLLSSSICFAGVMLTIALAWVLALALWPSFRNRWWWPRTDASSNARFFATGLYTLHAAMIGLLAGLVLPPGWSVPINALFVTMVIMRVLKVLASNQEMKPELKGILLGLRAPALLVVAPIVFFASRQLAIAVVITGMVALVLLGPSSHALPVRFARRAYAMFVVGMLGLTSAVPAVTFSADAFDRVAEDWIRIAQQDFAEKCGASSPREHYTPVVLESEPAILSAAAPPKAGPNPVPKPTEAELLASAKPAPSSVSWVMENLPVHSRLQSITTKLRDSDRWTWTRNGSSLVFSKHGQILRTTTVPRLVQVWPGPAIAALIIASLVALTCFGIFLVIRTLERLFFLRSDSRGLWIPSKERFDSRLNKLGDGALLVGPPREWIAQFINTDSPQLIAIDDVPTKPPVGGPKRALVRNLDDGMLDPGVSKRWRQTLQAWSAAGWQVIVETSAEPIRWIAQWPDDAPRKTEGEAWVWLLAGFDKLYFGTGSRLVDDVRDSEKRFRQEGGSRAPDGLLAEVLDAHYERLWMLCTPDERLVLIHIAEEGFVNPECHHVRERLVAIGLVRDHHPALFSWGFRHYVMRQARRLDVAKMEQESGPSGWSAARMPIMLGVATLLLLLFTTHPELATGGAVIPALTTTLPGILRLIGGLSMFGSSES